MTSALVAGYAAIVLLGAISGRSTGTSCAADSLRSTTTCVTRRSAPPALPCTTGPPCSFASASGTIFTTVPLSTAAMPCMRSAESSVGYTRLRGTGRADTMLTVPFTRGSTMKLRPVISATALTTASMSALTKLSVTASFAGGAAPLAAGTPVGATAGSPGGVADGAGAADGACAMGGATGD